MADEDPNSEVENKPVKDDNAATVSEQDSVAGETDGERNDKAGESSWSAPILSFARKASETISSAGLRNPLSGSEAPNPGSSESINLSKAPAPTPHITTQLQPKYR